jgi:dTDP-4-dehydrorhamnose 3,5-epimerase
MDKLEIKETNLDKVLIITPPTIFEDYRGIYSEIYNRKLYQNNGLDQDFKSDCFIFSDKNVLRGIHGDEGTWKLVSCLMGRFYIVIVNCDKESINFGESFSMTLSETNKKQILVPPKHGIGHLILSDKAIYHYKQSEYYEDKKEFVFNWDYKFFNLTWPINNPILSIKDAQNHD